MDKLIKKIDSIVIFKNVKENPVIRALRKLLLSDRGDRIEAYADFVAELFDYNYNFTEFIVDAVVTDENKYVIMKSNGEEIPEVLESCFENELRVFDEISNISTATLKKFVGYSGYLPEYVSGYDSYENDNLIDEYKSRLKDLNKVGYGIYAHNTMFRFVDGEIVPVKTPDKTSVSDLFGYEREREMLIDNTKALLEGRPAANTLLVGDAGTGKSSTVKAVANLLSDEGLRLIEINKAQISRLPEIMEIIHENPLKFIIFIDDLSFNAEDNNLGTLKAILEGGVSTNAENCVIYATSNRRHLIKETFSDREGDDIHRQDTIQEQISLSDRFGLTILYTRPSKDLYLEIVHNLAKKAGIEMDENELDIKASAFALRKGGFSPRAAKQFTNSLL